MRLLTQEIRGRLPALGDTDGDRDPVAYVKFFATFADWTWYVTEFDGKDTFFGLVYGHVSELGYFSLGELESGEGRRHQVERDLHFIAKPLSEVRELHSERISA